MPQQLAFLIYPGFQLLDVTGPLTVFECAEAHAPGCYGWQLVAPQGGAVPSSSGVATLAAGLPPASGVDRVIVSGGLGLSTVLGDASTLDWLRAVAAAGGQLASVCSGSLLLAATGLLDGRRATTHWARSQEFRERFPKVRLDADRMHVRDGSFWTSAGITAGIDLALAMVGESQGEELARRVARDLVFYHRRPGGQSQFSTLLDMFPEGARFAALLDHVRAHLRERHAVADLADRMNLGPRHFVRAFTAEIGVAPSKAVERLRVEAARAALEQGERSIRQVALDCGFGQVERMRRSFIRQLGQPPSELRRVRRLGRESCDP